MGTGYTRNDVSNNIADGNIINASDLDGEFDAVESAFNSSTGHTHDGTAAEGGAITVVGPVQDLVVSATEVKPKTTNTLDLGTSGLLYKDAYLQGNMYFRDTALKIVSSADGQLDIDADVELELVAPTVDIDASTAVTVDTASTTFTSTVFNVTGSANITGDLDVDNINIDGNTIISTDTNGAINITPNGTGAVNITATTNITGDLDVDNINIDGNTIISTDTNGDINISPDGTGTVVIDTDLDVDNINVNGNTVSSTDTNGDINLSPNGTGTVVINTDLDVDNININGNTIISTDTNGNIALTPNGTGEVDISKVDIDSGAIDGVTLGTNSAVTEAQVDNININGNTISSTDTNGNLTIDPNGTGNIVLDANVGIGTTSPAVGLQVEAGGEPTIRLNSSGLGVTADFKIESSGGILRTTTSHPLILKTNNTEAMRIDSSGNVGIGTSSPGAKIDINSSTQGDVYFRGGTGSTRRLELSTFATSSAHAGHDFNIASTGGTFSFSINGSEAMRIDESGDVGIGTSSPSTPSGKCLTLYDSIIPRLNFKNATTGNTSTDGSELYVSGNQFVIQNREASAIVFSTPTERMRIDGDGDVGIATSSPNARLEVEDAGTTNSVILKVTADNASPYAFVVGNDTFSTTDTDGMAIWMGNTGEGTIDSRGTGAIMRFRTNGTEHMRIDSSGNVTLTGSDGKIYLPQTPSTYNWIGDSIEQTGIVIVPTNDGTSERLSFATNNAERMRIDSSGDVNILSGNTLRVGGTTDASAQGSINTGLVNFRNPNTPSGERFQLDCEGTAAGQTLTAYYYDGVSYRSRMSIAGNSSGETVFNESSQDIDFRVESDGNANMLFVDGGNNYVYIGKNTSAVSTNGILLATTSATISADSAVTTNTWHTYNTATSAYTFYVSTTGTVNYTALNALSDQREKTNIVDLPVGLDAVKQLRPRQFDWINEDQENNVYGFIAQEVEEVLPNIVTDYMKDESVYRKGLKHIELVAVLTKAIQEQQTLIETLEARITALEAS